MNKRVDHSKHRQTSTGNPRHHDVTAESHEKVVIAVKK